MEENKKRKYSFICAVTAKKISNMVEKAGSNRVSFFLSIGIGSFLLIFSESEDDASFCCFFEKF